MSVVPCATKFAYERIQLHFFLFSCFPSLFSLLSLFPSLSLFCSLFFFSFLFSSVLSSFLLSFSLFLFSRLKGKMYPLVYPRKSDMISTSLCMENSLDSRQVRGKIVICDRGNNGRVAKGMVVQKAGGVGMILANGISNGEGLIGDAHLLPTAAVGAEEGDVVKAYVASTKTPSATIDFQGTVIGISPAPVVASFSGHGPNGLNPEILKPDLIAPGVNILVAWTDAMGPTGLQNDNRKTEFNILSGTSMASHVSGAAALLKSAHPDWSPAVREEKREKERRK